MRRQVLDTTLIDGKHVLLDGKGAALQPGGDPIFLDIEQGVIARNSLGEAFDPQPVWPPDFTRLFQVIDAVSPEDAFAQAAAVIVSVIEFPIAGVRLLKPEPGDIVDRGGGVFDVTLRFEILPELRADPSITAPREG